MAPDYESPWKGKDGVEHPPFPSSHIAMGSLWQDIWDLLQDADRKGDHSTTSIYNFIRARGHVFKIETVRSMLNDAYNHRLINRNHHQYPERTYASGKHIPAHTRPHYCANPTWEEDKR